MMSKCSWLLCALSSVSPNYSQPGTSYHRCHKQGPVSKLLITDMALEWFVASVNPYVLQQVRGSVTGLGTVSANISLLLVCVFFHVVSQVTLVPPALATKGALEGAKSRVTGLAVVPESLQVYEFYTTLWAGMGPSLIFFLFQKDLHV